jgi:hypothetical protein
MIRAALLAVTVFRPEKNSTLYEKTPVNASATTGKNPLRSRIGILRWVLRTKRIKKSEAAEKRKKAAEKGPISRAMILPAMKVPPQKTAVRTSFR